MNIHTRDRLGESATTLKKIINEIDVAYLPDDRTFPVRVSDLRNIYTSVINALTGDYQDQVSLTEWQNRVKTLQAEITRLEET